MPEACLEPQLATDLDPVKNPIIGPLRGRATRITPERSRELLERRRQLKSEREKAGIEREQLLHKLADIASRAEPKPAPDKDKPDAFVSVSLARCRAQLDKLYAKLNDQESKLTATEVDKLASAIAKFSEIERNLAMRPGPGTLKPGEPNKTQTRASWLLSAQDEPVQGHGPVPGKAEQE